MTLQDLITGDEYKPFVDCINNLLLRDDGLRKLVYSITEDPTDADLVDIYDAYMEDIHADIIVEIKKSLPKNHPIILELRRNPQYLLLLMSIVSDLTN